MNKITLAILLSLSSAAASAQTRKAPLKKAAAPVAAPAPAMNNGLDSASYAFGMVMATNLKGDGLASLNYELMVKGLKDAFQQQKALLTKEESQTAINNLFKEVSKQKNAAQIAKGKAFFEKNKQVAGVQTTASGLQYLVVKPGNGAKPTANDKVKVHYKGTLLDGTTFDSSYDRGEPISLNVSQVIPGWTEGLQLMATGAHYRFFIPYALAYGERSPGPQIPAYSDLIFEVELLEIEK